MTSRALRCPMPQRAMPLQPVELAGRSLLSGDYDAAADWLTERASGTSPIVIAHVNLNNYYALSSWGAGEFPQAGEFEMIFDGIGLKLAAWLVGRGWVRDLNGTDLFPLVMQRAAGARLRVFFLGATPDVVARAAERTAHEFPGVSVVGYHHGYFAADAADAVVERVSQSRADILIIGMGCPRQEAFALQHRTRLGAKLIWTAGGLFDFVAGARPRAPRLLRRLRLEWLYRLALEPRRMWWRNTVPPLWLAWHLLRWRVWS